MWDSRCLPHAFTHCELHRIVWRHQVMGRLGMGTPSGKGLSIVSATCTQALEDRMQSVGIKVQASWHLEPTAVQAHPPTAQACLKLCNCTVTVNGAGR